MKAKYKCYMKIDSLLKAMKWRGFQSTTTKQWCAEWILKANDLIDQQEYQEALTIVQTVEDAYYQEYLDRAA